MPLRMPFTTASGKASASTLRPTDNAVKGSTELAMTSCILRLSVHFASSPKVSKRNICLPCSTRAFCAASVLAASVPPPPELPPHAAAAPTAAAMISALASLRRGICCIADCRSGTGCTWVSGVSAEGCLFMIDVLARMRCSN